MRGHWEGDLIKDTDLSVYSQEELDSIADLLSNRPPATLDWRSPIQAMRNLVQGMNEQRGVTIH